MARQVRSYEDYLDAVEDLDFVEDRGTADAVVKAILGIVASSLDERRAKKLAAHLPDPLTIGKLRSHQAQKLDITVREFAAEIAAEFGYTDQEAMEAIQTVLHVAKSSISESTLMEIEDNLPRNIRLLMETIQ